MAGNKDGCEQKGGGVEQESSGQGASGWRMHGSGGATMKPLSDFSEQEQAVFRAVEKGLARERAEKKRPSPYSRDKVTKESVDGYMKQYGHLPVDEVEEAAYQHYKRLFSNNPDLKPAPQEPASKESSGKESLGNLSPPQTPKPSGEAKPAQPDQKPCDGSKVPVSSVYSKSGWSVV
jgi:hypothetical protein